MSQPAQLRAVLSAVDRMSPVLRQINVASRATRKAVADIGTAVTTLRGNLGMPTGIGLAAGLAATVAAGKKIVDVSAQFEDFSATLVTVMGSAEKAGAAMAWVENFATQTPYELADVTKAFVAIRVLGVDPMKGALKAAGDAAAVMNRPLEEATSALASAMRGNTEMLDQFGIRAKIVKDEMVLMWNVQGKDFATTVDKMNGAAIASKVGGIWERMFGGQMERKAQTWNGILSNIADQWTRFVRLIGSSGAFDYAKTQAQALLDRINALQEDGTLARWAKSISDDLIEVSRGVVDFIRGFDWQAFRAGIKSAWSEWTGFVAAVGGAGKLLRGIGIILLASLLAPAVSVAAAISRLTLVLGGIALANPVLAAVAAATLALGAAGWKLYENWDSIADGLSKTWQDIKNAFATVADAIESRIEALVQRFRSMGAGIAEFMKNPLGAIGSMSGLTGGKTPMLPSQIQSLASTMGGRYNVDPKLVQAVIAAESGGNAKAVSSAGAMGLMQLMPATARRFGVNDAYDPAQNVRGGTAYLSWLLNRYRGNIPKAVAAYNAGEGNVDKYGGIPPFAETRSYVQKVLHNYRGLMRAEPQVDLNRYRAASVATVEVNFSNAPPGTRVEPKSAPGAPAVKTKMGYRQWR